MPGELRAADRTGIRLGMKPPVCRIPVLPFAVGAHWKDLHGGLGAIIGDCFNNCETWTAIRAVDEGIVKSPVSGVEEFGPAIIAESDIRRDGRVCSKAGCACKDGERSNRNGIGQWPFFNRRDAGKWRGLVFEGLQKQGKPIVSSQGLNDHSVTGIADSAGDLETRGELVDKGSKSYTLDDATDKDFDPDLIMLLCA
jgi:hypothetical protein